MWSAALCGCIEDELAPPLIGQDARNISRLWDVMYNGSRAHFALARGHAFQAHANLAARLPLWCAIRA
jgi:hypothetical protein